MYWPTDTGPLKTLRDLEQLEETIPPAWLRGAHAFHDDGRDIYLSHPSFLTFADLEDLRTLHAHGYEIAIFPRTGERIRVVIRTRQEPHATP